MRPRRDDGRSGERGRSPACRIRAAPFVDMVTGVARTRAAAHDSGERDGRQEGPLAGAVRALPRRPDDRARHEHRERGSALIQTDLGFSQTALAWVVNAYML